VLCGLNIDTGHLRLDNGRQGNQKCVRDGRGKQARQHATLIEDEIKAKKESQQEQGWRRLGEGRRSYGRNSTRLGDALAKDKDTH